MEYQSEFETPSDVKKCLLHMVKHFILFSMEPVNMNFAVKIPYNKNGVKQRKTNE